ncbi:hypothetical protein OTU49_012467, partial [Cherax quadricarinatus]
DLGSSEESGKDWSDLEREAAEADKDANEFQDEYTKQNKKKGGNYRDKYNDRKRLNRKSSLKLGKDKRTTPSINRPNMTVASTNPRTNPPTVLHTSRHLIKVPTNLQARTKIDTQTAVASTQIRRGLETTLVIAVIARRARNKCGWIMVPNNLFLL